MNQSTSRMLNRVKAVYLYIKERDTVSTTELAEEFGITDRTVQRDLNVLEYNGLVQSPHRGVWSTTSKKVKIS
ncbi:MULTISPECIES: DeoR family transcriptional regulator [Bacillaceae]|uniref:Alkaline phosphatase n=1 Tax=Terribacillus saccharophilus TaxID=361277 RepID=A0A1H7Y8A0_9BACI|nr:MULTISPECIES: DeoR family transcriptional regulator [Bacillaceae]AIF67147.1 alkaline phosphatase [Terribacillus goriensis]MCM3224086.1 DeoR family transcriptional regulator [Terribacillus saccharophilus]MEC0284505.1 DeoR family transcriptional regulator [Terribacillus saccharophilus]MEC0290953.1 DeoR family transcriptional regulator [Terribacillus saccharophilus]MEC0302966.1 DeoR family transcriptional regulator [Terribacillus saccharophilus]